ncbi:MAG: SIS domain-containing protein [Candidatus Kariarchaeaceae archaeon]|jgi:glucose/mannose-6-phosphate isomerase
MVTDLNEITEDLFRQVFASGENFVRSMESTLNTPFECEKLIICGMGGSGISGDYIKGLASTRSDKRVEINKTYALPRFVDDSWAAVVLSYSGNTEETLDMLGQLLERGIKPVTISSNGKLQEIAEKEGLESVQVPQGIAPRAAFPFLCGSLYGLVAQTLHLDIPDADTRARWIATSDFDTEPFDNLCEDMLGNFSLILQDDILAHVGLRFRCQLNENSKLSAASYIAPEFSHNAIVGFDGKEKGRSLILLRSNWEHQRTRIHLDFLSTQMQEQIDMVASLELEVEDQVQEQLRFTWILDYMSIKLAAIQDVDPLVVPSINRLKDVLKSAQ